MTDITDFRSLRSAVVHSLTDRRVLECMRVNRGKPDILIKVYGLLKDIQCTTLARAYGVALDELGKANDEIVSLRMILKVSVTYESHFSRIFWVHFLDHFLFSYGFYLRYVEFLLIIERTEPKLDIAF